MPGDLTFLMGNYPATLPTDRRYCRNHMWCQTLGDGRHRFGFTSYAVRLMQDVYFLEWHVNAGDTLALLQPIGHLETSKAMSDLFAPIAGILFEFNAALLADPSAINVSNYGDGWLFAMTGDAAGTLSPDEYHDFLAQNWEKTQRTLKGHV
jgi:glycine cleavage system H protein